MKGVADPRSCCASFWLLKALPLTVGIDGADAVFGDGDASWEAREGSCAEVNTACDGCSDGSCDAEGRGERAGVDGG